MKYNYYDSNKIVIHGKAVPGQTLAWGETKMLTADKIQSVNTTDYRGNVLYAPGLQRYKFNGKELDLVHGMRLYDYGARMYDQILGCWTSVDPMAEKYYHISPYAFCLNNPVRMVDRDGKDPWDFFPTADAAAIDFGYFYNDNSIRENREYASNIFRVRNAQGKIGYTYDVAISGGTKNITIK